MSEDRKTLKRGLDALLGDEPISSQQAQSQEIAIDKISPSRYQARENINQESLEELTESISSQGVIQPIIVRRVGETLTNSLPAREDGGHPSKPASPPFPLSLKMHLKIKLSEWV